MQICIEYHTNYCLSVFSQLLWIIWPRTWACPAPAGWSWQTPQLCWDCCTLNRGRPTKTVGTLAPYRDTRTLQWSSYRAVCTHVCVCVCECARVHICVCLCRFMARLAALITEEAACVVMASVVLKLSSGCSFKSEGVGSNTSRPAPPQRTWVIDRQESE